MMEGVSGDIQMKYQKVAAEYSKIRAQANVLKKAVLDEQTRNAELQNFLREKEQSLRKADQEMDSLTFRNQQLTKRVTVLQDELDVFQSRHKKGRSKAGDSHQGSDSGNHVIDEEFHKTIYENARLMSLMHDKDAAHAEEVSELKQRLESLEHELRQRHTVNNDAEIKYKSVIDKLEIEKQRLCESLEKQSRDFEVLSHDLQQSQQQLSKIKENSELNDLNVPIHDKKHQLHVKQMISQIGPCIRDLTAALSDFHKYSEQRLNPTSSQELSPVNHRFSSHLREHARYLHSLELGYKEFQEGVENGGSLYLESLPSLQKLSSQLTIYANYLCKLRQYHLLSIEDENSQSTCTGGLEECNKKVSQLITTFTNNFLKLSTYVHLLAAQSRRPSQHPPSSQKRFLAEITDILKDLCITIKDLAEAYSTKNTLEHELPTFSESLLTADECIVKSLSAMAAASLKLSGILADSRPELWKSVIPSLPNNTQNKSISIVASFRKKGAPYASLEQEEPIPYEEALRIREEVQNKSVICESLREQLNQSRERGTKLEKEKEHWRLEYQLLQLSHKKKVKDLEEQVQSLSGTSTPLSSDGLGDGDSCPQMNALGSGYVTNLLGRLELPITLTTEMESREQEVKNYFTERINELLTACQEAESKCDAVSAECQVLQKRLQLSLQSKQQVETAFQEAQDALTRLQDELHTTSQNYEAQLSIMSEHLANMNDKLTVQCDEIDQLKYQLSNKSSRKGKQK